MILCSAKRLKELKDQAMAKQSAGILLFRSSHELQILLVHSGGPFWAKKDEGSWSIPKGEYDEAEDALAAAKRELREETGIVVAGEFLELGTFKQPSGKLISAWAIERDFDPPAKASANQRRQMSGCGARTAAGSLEAV